MRKFNGGYRAWDKNVKGKYVKTSIKRSPISEKTGLFSSFEGS